MRPAASAISSGTPSPVPALVSSTGQRAPRYCLAMSQAVSRARSVLLMTSAVSIPGLARAQEQAVRQQQVQLRGRGRDRDKEQVDIGHRRAEQLAGPGQDLLEEALLLRGAGRRKEHLVPDHGADALLAEAPARAADIELPSLSTV